ncbi:uncharacterized protein PHALS_01927 [Plasmopara halstedii]|uniref:Uncharacterized protein n=1 Tax=Plasmopara halstedii TaxID=4781 RepID=A0A0P1AW14_PLAHL|nr:uncharacterized protein PHALS_01927 [Plasmopara halstedii]CEG45644.1 hypothetical protein PHALS_01927 [Plasmopara halstedii]|eukprot:XP_024582013.1 hypothetical protein PHALS_01927 [Plasmopara halstedii]
MRFFSPSTYLRHAPDKVEAAYKVFQKVGVDKVTTNLFDSSAYRKWSNYLDKAFPNEFKRVAQLKVVVLVEHGQDTLINSILTAQVGKGELPFTVYFEDALIEILANAKGVQKEFADRLDDALFNYSKYLQKLHGGPKDLRWKKYKSIGDRIEGKLFFELTTSNTKNLVDDDVAHPILSSKREGRREPHLYLRDAYNPDEAATILLMNAHVDKAKGDLFTSHEFQTWSKIIVDAFPEDLRLRAIIMDAALQNLDRKRLVDAISTAQLVNGKLLFDDYFIDELLVHSEYFESSLFRLSENLQSRGGDSRTIGEQLGGGLLVRHFGTRRLLDVINLPNVQKWYFSLPKKEGKTAASFLYHRLERQRIKFDAIGDAYLNAEGGAAKKMMKEVVEHVLELRMKTLMLEKAIVARSSEFDRWVANAVSLNADVATSVLPTLQKFLSNEKIVFYCADARPSSKEAKALVKEIQKAIKPSKT